MFRRDRFLPMFVNHQQHMQTAQVNASAVNSDASANNPGSSADNPPACASNPGSAALYMQAHTSNPISYIEDAPAAVDNRCSSSVILHSGVVQLLTTINPGSAADNPSTIANNCGSAPLCMQAHARSTSSYTDDAPAAIDNRCSSSDSLHLGVVELV